MNLWLSTDTALGMGDISKLLLGDTLPPGSTGMEGERESKCGLGSSVPGDRAEGLYLV